MGRGESAAVYTSYCVDVDVSCCYLSVVSQAVGLKLRAVMEREQTGIFAVIDDSKKKSDHADEDFLDEGW